MKTLNRHNIRNILAATILLSAIPAASSAAPQAEVRRAEIVHLVDPIYPISLSSMGIYEGSTTILIEVDSRGDMTDWIALSATRMEFVESVARVIDQWKFKSATRDGVAIPYSLSLTINFKSDGLMMSVNGFQMVQAFLYGNFNPVDKPLVAKFSELDNMPRPTKVVEPAFTADVPKDVRNGSVEMGFFIDTNGKVRMPVLLECNGDIRLAYAAYDALMQWEFNTPTVRGRPMMVRARQQFIFSSSNGVAK